MNSKVVSMAVLAAMIALPSVSHGQDVGEYALAQYQGGTKWFSATVIGRTGNSVRVQYDAGHVETRPANQVRPYTWRQGSNLECKWTDGQWYAARINAIASDLVTLTVRYEDGTVEQITTSRCRSN